jgi:hypothetical protein
MRKSPGHVSWVRALSLIMLKEDPLELYKIDFALELVKWLLNGRLVKFMFFFPKFMYRKSKPLENDLDMRKSPGHVSWVRASSLIMCKEDPLKLYKIKFATELINWFLNGRLVNMMFFPKFT